MPHIHNQQHSAIIALPVRFNFSAHAEFFKQCENALVENRYRCLTLDFAAVQHIDSAAIGMMINASKKAAQQGSSLTIQNASGDVDGILALIKFEAVLQQHQTDARVNAAADCE